MLDVPVIVQADQDYEDQRAENDALRLRSIADLQAEVAALRVHVARVDRLIARLVSIKETRP